ncbi:unnamed protein product [Symbiodinium necroappetens]|uniref:Uncharacterized protein n=1 Tax=Symbiodinium necroappetens TaxID=1628268 RepID=A0A812YMP3_9DINO|nr:unnamed protein product [Symbiodinium necroappetens]
MLRPGTIDTPRLFYERYDPFLETQQLLQEHRRLHVQERHARDAGVNGILMIDAGQDCNDPTMKDDLDRQGRLKPDDAIHHTGKFKVQADVARRKLTPRCSGAARAAAEIRFRRLGTDKPKDFSRRNVLLKEQLRHECRLPAAATWAGEQTEFMRQRFNKQATIRHELGDGRTLPHERRED